MEAILAMPSPDRAREYVLPLSLAGVQVRAIAHTGHQLLAEVGREPADCLILTEELPDGPAEVWLARIASHDPRRPPVAVLAYGADREALRERVRAAYGLTAEVVVAGDRPAADVAAEAAQVLAGLVRVAVDQDREAVRRLSQPAGPGVVPQPVRRSGAVALVGASGGVGTSTLAANLAALAAMAGHRVLLVDAQLATGASSLHLFGADPDEDRRGMQHLRWAHLGAQGAARDDVAGEVLGRLVPVQLRSVRHADLRLLHVPAGAGPMAAVAPETVAWAVQVLEGRFDLVLLDLGSGLGDPRTQRLLAAASRAYVVVGAWGTSVHALARALAGEGVPARDRLHLLVREAPASAYGARAVQAAAGMPISGRIPDDPGVRQRDLALGLRPLPVVADPDGPYARAVAHLAYALGLVEASGQPAARPARGLLGRWWQR